MFNEKGLSFSKIIILIGKCDLRKGIDGLCGLIKAQYGQNPLEKGTLFLFCGTKKDRIKGVLWAGDRYILLYIRLAEGSFRWPRTQEEARRLSGEEFMRLMDGFDIDSSVGKKHVPQPIEIKKKRQIT